MKVRRVAAGFYTIETALGVFEVRRVESAGLGMYEPTKVVEWIMWWPEAPHEEYSETFARLSDAKARVASLTNS